MSVLQSLERGLADLIVFPELSLSNYDPDIVSAVAIEPDDCRMDSFKQFSRETGMAVAVGAPLKTSGNPLIAMLVFLPGRKPVVVGKRYLHPDEIAYFSPSEGSVGILDLAIKIAIAICYEISVVEHTAAVMEDDVALYLASVAKTADGVSASLSTLSEVARRYEVPVLMVNSVGTCEGKVAGGGSLVIDRTGRLLAQLDKAAEGLLIFDTDTQTVIKKMAGNENYHEPKNH